MKKKRNRGGTETALYDERFLRSPGTHTEALVMHLHFGRRKPRAKPLAGIGNWLSSIQQRVVAADNKDLVVDIATVEAVNSRELGEIAKLHLALRDQGHRLILRNAQQQVHEVFEMTRMNRLVEVHERKPTAVG